MNVNKSNLITFVFSSFKAVDFHHRCRCHRHRCCCNLLLTFASISRLTSSRRSRSFVRVHVLAATSRDTHSLLPPRSPHISLLSACAVRLVGRWHSSEIERTLSKHNLVVSLSWARHCRSVILRASCVSTPDVDVVAGFLLRGCCRCECLCGLVWSRDQLSRL